MRNPMRYLLRITFMDFHSGFGAMNNHHVNIFKPQYLKRFIYGCDRLAVRLYFSSKFCGYKYFFLPLRKL